MKLLVWLFGAIAVASLIGNFLLFGKYSTSRPLVRVGNITITKKMYLDTLEYEAGTPVLKKLVYSALVLQTASKEHLMPTEAEIDERIAEIERKSPQMLSTVNQNAVQMQQFRKDLATDMALENLRIQNVTASPSEIEAYYAMHKNVFGLPQQVQTTMVVTENDNNAGTAEELLQDNQPEDVIARQPGMHVAGVNGFNVNMQALSIDDRNKVSKMVFAMKPGQIQTISVHGAYLTFKIKNSAPVGVPPLSQIQDQVARAVKLSKAPTPTWELANLYQKINPKFDAVNYSNEFADMANFDLNSPTEKNGAGQ